jgi:hypothetical protein
MERMREIERRMHPRATSDFEILYNELEAWRLSETEKLRKKKLSAVRAVQTDNDAPGCCVLRGCAHGRSVRSSGAFAEWDDVVC